MFALRTIVDPKLRALMESDSSKEVATDRPLPADPAALSIRAGFESARIEGEFPTTNLGSLHPVGLALGRALKRNRE